MEKEEEEEEDLFIEWPAEEGQQESTKDEDVETETETERKSSFRVSLANRRASLPCPAQLSTMHLTHLNHLSHLSNLTHLMHLHAATMAPSSVNMRRCLKGGETRKGPHSEHEDLEKQPKASPSSAIKNLLPEKPGRFRSRNVISLSDADSMCLICHGDLCRREGTVRELHCSHSFHSECIEAWLWMKQTCPICHKHMAMPEPLYWMSAHLKVP